jgi:hypothetical protein
VQASVQNECKRSAAAKAGILQRLRLYDGRQHAHVGLVRGFHVQNAQHSSTQSAYDFSGWIYLHLSLLGHTDVIDSVLSWKLREFKDTRGHAWSYLKGGYLHRYLHRSRNKCHAREAIGHGHQPAGGAGWERIPTCNMLCTRTTRQGLPYNGYNKLLQ